MRTIPRFTALLIVAAALCPGVQGQAPAEKTTVSPSVQQRQAPVNLDGLVTGFRYEELAQAVEAMPQGVERDYFAGVLANREGRVADSITLLERALPNIKTGDPRRASVALHSLGDDYVKLYSYNDAIGAYQELLDRFGSQLDKAERQSTEDDYKTLVLLKDTPAQTISFAGPVEIATQRNPTLDTIDAKLTVNGVTEPWILDTGANFTTVTTSFARRLGLKLSSGKAQTQGITGAENELRVAVIPELKVGGATVRNVVALVLKDESLNVPVGTSHYQINAILGYPVLHALKRVTFTHDGRVLAGPASPSTDSGAKLYMNQLMPLLECSVRDRKVLFSFDTGANSSFFSVRYYREFPAQFKGLKKKPHGMGGAGGLRKLMAYYLPEAQLGIGSTTAVLHDVPVLPELGTDTDKFFGNLGRDVTDPYRSFTIDFENMRFQLGEKLPAESPK